MYFMGMSQNRFDSEGLWTRVCIHPTANDFTLFRFEVTYDSSRKLYP